MIPYTYRLLLAENFALLVGLLFVSLHQILQSLFIGQVFLYLVVQHLQETKEVSILSSKAEQGRLTGGLLGKVGEAVKRPRKLWGKERDWESAYEPG